jgi:murein tripeptide amidase MpaA
LLTITNFKNQKDKKEVFITSRVHPGETPSSFVCEGIISFLISNCEEAKRLRDYFVFKIIPMLNPDGVINGNYRCSLSGYDLNRVWHYDNKISSPEIFFAKKAILDQRSCLMFIDLHAHSKKKGVFMYGCQNRANPQISRHIPYLFWKEIASFNYYQCNFGMRLGREGTSRLAVHHLLKLPYSYTM